MHRNADTQRYSIPRLYFAESRMRKSHIKIRHPESSSVKRTYICVCPWGVSLCALLCYKSVRFCNQNSVKGTYLCVCPLRMHLTFAHAYVHTYVYSTVCVCTYIFVQHSIQSLCTYICVQLSMPMYIHMCTAQYAYIHTYVYSTVCRVYVHTYVYS